EVHGGLRPTSVATRPSRASRQRIPAAGRSAAADRGIVTTTGKSRARACRRDIKPRAAAIQRELEDASILGALKAVAMPEGELEICRTRWNDDARRDQRIIRFRCRSRGEERMCG